MTCPLLFSIVPAVLSYQYCSGCVVLSVLFRLCCSISIVPSVLSYLYCAIMYERNADRKYEGDRDAKEQNTKE